MPLSLAQDIPDRNLIALAPQVRDCVAATHGDVLRKLGALLRPYKVQFDMTHEGLRVNGDAIAIDLVQRILDALARADLVNVDASLAETAHAVIDKALQQDLAFRLPGLRYPLRPLSLSQVMFLNTLLHDPHELFFGLGPSGTGKTHLAIAAGLNLLAEGRVKSLVLTKPHILAEGEVMTPALRAETTKDPQLTIFFDELHDLIGEENLKAHIEAGEINILPLGLMRGRTFNNAYIVLDEAQNATVKKMRMAVNRIGRGSRMVITGDPSHVDLHEDEPSGLSHLLNLMRGSDLAHIHLFEKTSVIRNGLAARLDALYEAQGEH